MIFSINPWRQRQSRYFPLTLGGDGIQRYFQELFKEPQGHCLPPLKSLRGSSRSCIGLVDASLCVGIKRQTLIAWSGHSPAHGVTHCTIRPSMACISIALFSVPGLSRFQVFILFGSLVTHFHVTAVDVLPQPWPADDIFPGWGNAMGAGWDLVPFSSRTGDFLRASWRPAKHFERTF
jgi:hypothetical protein